MIGRRHTPCPKCGSYEIYITRTGGTCRPCRLKQKAGKRAYARHIRTQPLARA